MFPFSIFCAAVFAEPSVTEIEEVIGLVHGTAAVIRRWTVSIDRRHLIVAGSLFSNRARVGAFG